MRRVLKFVFLLVFFFTSYLYNEKLKRDIERAESRIKYEAENKKNSVEVPEALEEVTVYYPDSGMDRMLVSKEKIKKEKDLRDKLNRILALIKEKTKGSTSYDKKVKQEFMPEYLEIESVYYDSGALYIDFNMDFRREFVSKEHELYFTYSVVNSFTEIERIEKVKFLILGKEIRELKFYKLNDFLFKYKKI